MATNYEYFKDEITEIVAEGNTVALKDGHPVSCGGMRCSACGFNGQFGTCRPMRKSWLNAEHIEKPKLTKKERMFCELVETGWIARDSDALLVHYKCKPEKANWSWVNGDKVLCIGRHFNSIADGFSFITWDDKEPWSVEELLKLEVMEE